METNITPEKKQVPAVKKIAKMELLSNYIEHKYILPVEIVEPIENLINDIKEYEILMSKNTSYIERKQGRNSNFEAVSNHRINVLFHLQDDKFAMKLIEVENNKGEKVVFDAPADCLTKPDRYNSIMSGIGNFVWFGTQNDFKKVQRFLYDKMDKGQKIEVLGFQKGINIWVWNNSVNLLNGQSLKIDDNGVFKHQNISYYVPSANKRYLNNPDKFEKQKQFILLQNNVPLEQYLKLLYQVFQNKIITAVLFSISSIFQDIIALQIKHFPILFLQGEHGSGKDQICQVCQSFFGIPTQAINLEGGASTKVAAARHLAEFCNAIGQYSEYKNGDKDTDGLMKGIYDRNAYIRGNNQSKVATESIPISSSAILTGNQYPNQEALMSRFLWIELNKNKHTLDEKKIFSDWLKILNVGVSCYTNEILNYRKLFENDFYNEMRKCEIILQSENSNIESRVIENYSIIFASFQILKNKINFHITENEIKNIFSQQMEFIDMKLKSDNLTCKFWDLFLICCKIEGSNRLLINIDYKINSNEITFNFKNIFSKIQRQWSTQNRENAPNWTTITEKIKNSGCFIENKDNQRIERGKNPTSAMIVDISKTNIYDDFMEHLKNLTQPL